MSDLVTLIEDVLISAAFVAFARGEHVDSARLVIQSLPPERRLALWPERRRSRSFTDPSFAQIPGGKSFKYASSLSIRMKFS